MVLVFPLWLSHATFALILGDKESSPKVTERVTNPWNVNGSNTLAGPHLDEAERRTGCWEDEERCIEQVQCLQPRRSKKMLHTNFTVIGPNVVRKSNTTFFGFLRNLVSCSPTLVSCSLTLVSISSTRTSTSIDPHSDCRKRFFLRGFGQLLPPSIDERSGALGSMI